MRIHARASRARARAPAGRARARLLIQYTPVYNTRRRARAPDDARDGHRDSDARAAVLGAGMLLPSGCGLRAVASHSAVAAMPRQKAARRNVVGDEVSAAALGTSRNNSWIRRAPTPSSIAYEKAQLRGID